MQAAADRPQLDDVEWFVRRLKIVDETGAVRRLSIRAEQLEIVRTFKTRKKILILKPRQIGASTVINGCLFWKAYTSPDPIGTLCVAHEMGSVSRMNGMLRFFANSLPDAIRPRLRKDNGRLLEFAHNGATFQQIMAGGRGSGKSYTYQNLHCTEQAYWPRGSASLGWGQRNSRAIAVDDMVWSSALSTLHKTADSHVIVESTPHGPSGRFYENVLIARESDEWAFLFFPWFQFHEYERDLPAKWEITDDEARLLTLYAPQGMTVQHLAWRRYKIVDEGYGEELFRMDFPTTWDEPFLLTGETWFDTTLLEMMTAALPKARLSDHSDLCVYARYDPARLYFVGVDTSGGTGGDWAVACVIDDTFSQVARWHSKKKKPSQQGDEIAKLAAMFGRARILTEKNNHGEAVIERLRALGCNLWTDERGKDFYTQGGRAGSSKKVVYDTAARFVGSGWVQIEDPFTLTEMKHVREQPGGNIEADAPHHDDHADALVLALYNARRAYRGHANVDAVQRAADAAERERMRQLKLRANNPWDRGPR